MYNIKSTWLVKHWIRPKMVTVLTDRSGEDEGFEVGEDWGGRLRQWVGEGG